MKKNNPFILIDGDLRLSVVKEDGWYVASSLDIRGLNTQAKSIEKVIENARDAAKLLLEDRADMRKELSSAAPPKSQSCGKARKSRLAKV